MTSAWGLGHHSPLSPLFDDPPGATGSLWWGVPRAVCFQGSLQD